MSKKFTMQALAEADHLIGLWSSTSDHMTAVLHADEVFDLFGVDCGLLSKKVTVTVVEGEVE